MRSGPSLKVTTMTNVTPSLSEYLAIARVTCLDRDGLSRQAWAAYQAGHLLAAQGKTKAATALYAAGLDAETAASVNRAARMDKAYTPADIIAASEALAAVAGTIHAGGDDHDAA